MTKPIKIVVRLAIGLLGLLIIAFLVAATFIDSIARKGIEAGATYALGVPTALNKADVGILSGSFSMAGLSVDNPKGFDGKFLGLGHGGVAVSLGTLASDTVVLPKLELSDVSVDLERGSSGANYKIILDNLKRLDSGQKSKEPSAPGKKFKINEILISNVAVHVSVLGGPGVNVPIQEIKLTNVGNDGSGVDMAKLTSTILEAVLSAAVSKGGGLIPSDISNELKGGLEQLSSLGNVGVEAVGKAGEEVTKIGKDVQGATEQLKKNVGDLIGGKKTDK
jgi:hypothetical protein